MHKHRYETMIVEDEPWAMSDMVDAVSHHPEIEVRWLATSVSKALEILSYATPDVVFLDVQLGDGDGFDLVPLFCPATEIIFVTAYNEYAVRAFEVNALDYLTKPVNQERLDKAVQRLTSRIRGLPAIHENHTFLPGDRVFVRAGQQRHFVLLADLVMLSSEGGNYSTLHLKDGKTLAVRTTLTRWENRLAPEMFARIHRTTIVNLHAICRFWSEGGGAYFVELANLDTPVRVSRGRAMALKQLIDAQILE